VDITDGVLGVAGRCGGHDPAHRPRPREHVHQPGDDRAGPGRHPAAGRRPGDV